MMIRADLRQFIIDLLKESETAIERYSVIEENSYPEIADKIIEKVNDRLLLIKFMAYMNDNDRDRYNQKTGYKLGDIDLNFTEDEIAELKSIRADLSSILPIE